MKKIGLFTSLILMVSVLFAQSIDEGKKLLNYEKFESAQGVFSKILTADPNNLDAAYWLGQTYLQNSELTDTAAAKALYQKTLQANPNSALMMVGVGEVELMEGKTADARNHFEAAINLTKKRDLADILLVVGRANVDTKAGDAVYAIDKLKTAADKDKKNADIQMVLGDAYRKLIDGANATVSYQNAMSLDPKNARPNFMIGRIYETQGFGQESIYMKYYNDAIAIDPNFAPVYYWLYMYYYNRDVNKAREYLTKYVALADNDSKLCYAQASLLYVSKLYDETIAKATECISTAGAKAVPNLYGLKAYAYDKLGDSAKAKSSFEEFFSKVSPEKIGPKDYATYAGVLFQFPGNEALAAEYIDKAITKDTIAKNKLEYVKDIAKKFYAEGKFDKAGVWYRRLLSMDTSYGKVDLFYAGYSDLRGENYKSADSVFNLYQQKYPEDLYGWYLGARSKEGMDTGQTGLAKPDYDKIIALADTVADKQSIKDKLIPAYRFMVAYYYNIQKDVESAVKYNDLILTVDPTDATALTNKEAFSKVTKNRAAAADSSKTQPVKKE